MRDSPHATPCSDVHDRRVKPRILLVDDHPPFVSAASSLLVAAGWDVVGWAGDGAAALAAVEQLRPEVVLLDVQLPDLDGFDVARALAALDDPPSVVLVSVRAASDYGEAVGRSGVRGFIEKSSFSVRALGDLLAGAP